MINKQKGFSAVEGLLILAMLVIVGFAGWFVLERRSATTDNSGSSNVGASTNQSLTTYNVPGESTNGSPVFNVSFYKNASVQPKNGLVYLISKSTDGTQSSIWVYKLKDEMPVCASGGTSFTIQIMGQSETGCYRNDRIIYTSDITHSGVKYQINLVSQKPIDISEGKEILSSVAIK